MTRKMKLLIQVVEIILLLTSVVLREVDLTRKGGHGAAHDISIRDDCSKVLNPHAKHYKLRTLNFPGVNWTCCAANPGFKIVGPCEQKKPNTTVVERCKEGTYISEFAHIRKKCDVDDLVCSDPFIKIPSNITQAPQCVCQDGFFLNKNKECTLYSECGPGWGVYRHGTSYKNTVCKQCRRGFISTTWSSSDRCLLNSSLLATKNLSSRGYPESTTPTTPVSTTSYTETSRATNPTPISKNKMKNNFEPPGVNSIVAFIAHPITTSLLTLVASFIAWCCLTKYVPNFSERIKNFSPRYFLQYFPRLFYSSVRSYSPPSNSDSKMDLREEISVLNEICTSEQYEQTIVESHHTGHKGFVELNASADEEHSSSGENQTTLVQSFPALSTLSLADVDKEIAKKTKQFKMFLAEKVDRDETKDLYRKYCAESNPEIFLDDCERHFSSTKEIFYAVWTRLEKRGTEQFNPTIVLHFFVDKQNNLVAEKIRENFSDLLYQ